MNANERRNRIRQILEETENPVSATVLAARLQVSRQLIVGDIALLRAGGFSVTSTSRGYILTEKTSSGCVFTIACFHSPEEMQAELYDIVDFGCTVLDVTIEHPLYGDLSGKLQLSSRYSVDCFIEKAKTERALPLSALTHGLHLHSIQAPDQRTRDQLLRKLERDGFLWHQGQ